MQNRWINNNSEYKYYFSGHYSSYCFTCVNVPSSQSFKNSEIKYFTLSLFFTFSIRYWPNEAFGSFLTTRNRIWRQKNTPYSIPYHFVILIRNIPLQFNGESFLLYLHASPPIFFPSFCSHHYLLLAYLFGTRNEVTFVSVRWLSFVYTLPSV
jgi:hypothetical protein